MKYNRKEKSDSLKLRYFLAIFIVVFLILFSHFIVVYTNRISEHDFHIINIANRQMMLSQKITKSVYGIQISKTIGERDHFRRELKSSIELLKKSYIGLRHGSNEIELPGNNSREIDFLFDKIKKEYNLIIKNSYEILALKEGESNLEKKIIPYIKNISENENEFLLGMDKIVNQYERESKEKFYKEQIISLILIIVTMTVLFLEVVLIFIPLVKDLKHKMDSLKINEKNLKKLFDVSPKMMCLVDPFDFKIMRLNQLLIKEFGIKEEEEKEYKITDFIDEKILRQMSVEYVNKNSKELKEIEVTVTDLKSNKRVMLMSLSIIYYHKKKVFLIGLTNISKQKNQEQLLKYYATIDDITGVLNRRSGMAVLSENFKLIKKKELDMTLCFIDIDNLSLINEKFGHTEGDIILKKISEIISQNMRSGDIVFRYGGDEIIVCFKYITHGFARVTINKIIEKMELLNKDINKKYELGFTYGMVEYKEFFPETIQEFIKQAEERMYFFKKKKEKDSV